MFKKLLIANRGEIACRIIRTARRMGIATVAVHSDADADAPFVRLADEAVAIGPAPAAQSYLVMDRIVAAAKQTGADAVHPGYGFLSENRAFAAALKEAGIVFVGPPPAAIAAMGDKIESKKLAAKAGVSTVPGHPDAVSDDAEAVRIADAIGYPVMIKASAGGGGKGMRIAHSAKEVADGLRSARNEARASFGDERVFIEKFIVEPRHVEIQVLADGHGNCLYLGERECSIQRRHQKVLEEAPSPALDAATRKAMGEQAVALARAVGYESAGTVEFIVDRERNFYFLEMNTRLQVEHPVTEMITGLDLVEQMLRVADGEKLPLTQDQVRLDGWAIETRVYAEDPERGFLPSIGRLDRYRPPVEVDGRVRVDAGVEEGSRITMFYDPMIAKLVTHGPTREAAIDRMADALDAYVVRGVRHNTGFLAAVMAHPRFREGRLSTAFIDEEFPDGYSPPAPSGAVRGRLVAVAAVIDALAGGRDAASTALRPSVPGSERVVTVAGEAVSVVLDADGADWTVSFEGRDVVVSDIAWRPGEPVFFAAVDGTGVAVQVDRARVGWRLAHRGVEAVAVVLTPRAAELARLMPEKVPPDLGRFLLSPMPGLLVSVAVKPGQAVKAGDELAVVEAMKMENILRAASDGVVKTLHAEPGSSLAVDQSILEFE
ncbi:MAG: acetyl-CoA carboxylase biotin carboxylase subunit [Alphaproteobacteria bacterium]